MGHDRETRVRAVALYLVGMPLRTITIDTGVSHLTVLKWVRRAGCFKMRREFVTIRDRETC